MVGETAETDAFIWAQARDTAPLTLRVLGPNQFAAEFVDVPTVVHGLCVVFHAIGLAPGTLYSYSENSCETFGTFVGLTPERRKATQTASGRRLLDSTASTWLLQTPG
jgi:hypothetical protein